MSEKRIKYDAEFREGAVRIVEETGKSVAAVARDLGVNEGTLGNWVVKARDAGKLHLVMDGVETLSYEDVLGAGQLAWMDASGLATDLGGFQLQEGSSLKPLTSEAGAALWELRKLMVKHFDSLPQKWKVAELYLTSEYAARESPWLRR